MKKYYLAALIALAYVCSSFINTDYRSVEAKHVMVADETVWEVANRFMDHQNKHGDVRDLIDDIREKNNLWGDKLGKIKPGDTIIIPLQCRK